MTRLDLGERKESLGFKIFLVDTRKSKAFEAKRFLYSTALSQRAWVSRMTDAYLRLSLSLDAHCSGSDLGSWVERDFHDFFLLSASALRHRSDRKTKDKEEQRVFVVILLKII